VRFENETQAINLLKKHNINVSEENYVLYPIKIQDEVKGYIGRATFQTKTKYRNSKTDFVNLLGGYLSDTNDICIVVEGIFDMINVKSILRQLNLDISVRCTFGAKISSNQIKMLKKERFETIILFFDLDVLKIIKQKSFELSKYFDVYAMFCPNEQMDAGDVDLELFSQILLNHKPLSYIANLCTNTKLL
jgi:hypothetical protein